MYPSIKYAKNKGGGRPRENRAFERMIKSAPLPGKDLMKQGHRLTHRFMPITTRWTDTKTVGKGQKRETEKREKTRDKREKNERTNTKTPCPFITVPQKARKIEVTFRQEKCNNGRHPPVSFHRLRYCLALDAHKLWLQQPRKAREAEIPSFYVHQERTWRGAHCFVPFLPCPCCRGEGFGTWRKRDSECRTWRTCYHNAQCSFCRVRYNSRRRHSQQLSTCYYPYRRKHEQKPLAGCHVLATS